MLNLQQFFWFVWLCNNVQTVHKASKFRESKCGRQGSRRQMLVWRLTILQFFGFKVFFLNRRRIVPDVKCPPGILGCQMPPGDIGASNANWGYWGVKCHPGVLGRQMPLEAVGASKATPRLLGRQRPVGVKRQGRQRAQWPYGVKGHKASVFRESKFGRQGSRRQRSRASKEMNPEQTELLRTEITPRRRASKLKLLC